MTAVIGYYGGPGAGKSVQALRLAAALKSKHLKADYVSEVVKQWARDGRLPVDYDQFLFFGKQLHRETSMYGKVDFVVTDAPVLLTAYYAQVFGSPRQAACFRDMYLTLMDMHKAKGHEHHHYFLTRTHPYDPEGRFQTEEQAKGIDVELRRYLREMGLNVKDIPSGDNVTEMVMADLGV